MKTSWNFRLFYKSINDYQIDKDVAEVKTACIKFKNKYSANSSFLNSEKKLSIALQDYEKLMRLLYSSKPVVYFYYLNSINSSDSKIQIKLSSIMNKYSKYQNETIFFTHSLKKLTIYKQKNFLKSKLLKRYHYFLQHLFRQSKYCLGEEAERVINLKYQPAHFMWVKNNEKLLNQQTVYFKRKFQPISLALNQFSSLKLADRRQLQKILFTKFKDLSDNSEAELNAILLNKSINDDLRGFTEPYEDRIIADQLDKQTLSSLVGMVSATNEISYEFYKIKKKILKIPQLYYEDRNANIGKITKKITFAKAVTALNRLYREINPEYEEIFNKFLLSGQIDVYSKQGKDTGAYCSSTFNNPTMVLLNYAGDYNSLFTLAHEMGHALHSEYTKKQPVLYQQHSTATAEVASTLFENLLFDYLLSTASRREKIILLHNRLHGDMSSIFRQIAFFNFEYELHKKFQKQGGLIKNEIVNLLNKHLKLYLGPSFKLRGDEGYSFVHISHFRNFFYVYSYAFGQLISRLLGENLKNDKNYIKQIQYFLESGSHASPRMIFKNIGVDITSKKTWETGLNYIKRDVLALKKLVNG